MQLAGSRTPTVLVCHLGYGRDAIKTAHVALPPNAVLDAVVLRGASGERRLAASEPLAVAGWSGIRYATVDFSEATEAGGYRVVAEVDGAEIASAPFEIAPDRLQSIVVADLTAYFRGARSSGEIDRKDRHARFHDDDSGREVDARGGWLDASGDYSKFLSHLTYTRMMSPQQIPLAAWAFAQAAEELGRAHPDLRTGQYPRLRDEALFGADFLVRFQDQAGFFYTAIFDALTKELEQRVITAPLQDSVRTQRWQAAYRHGGGMAIAALARAATLDDHGDFESERYWLAAVRGFEHLEAHNAEYLFDGRESVIDDYCALLAAVELVRAARRRGAEAGPFTSAAVRRAGGLTARLRHDEAGRAYLHGDAEGAPFFHAAEPGLPIVALILAARELPELAGSATELAVSLLRGLAERTDAVANPFGYPRQRVRPLGGAPRDAFFFPHENETGYWWQGENAGLASFAYAACLGARIEGIEAGLADRLRRLSADAVAWVAGLNPFDSCMLQGRGRNTVEYSGVYQNSPGGIMNGITSGFDDEDGIALLPEDAPAGNAWRWAEQWIPHSAWFLLAACAAS